MVDRSDRLALLPPVINPRLKGANVQAIYALTPYPRRQQRELQGIVVEAAFVLVLQHEFRRSLSSVRVREGSAGVHDALEPALSLAIACQQLASQDVV